LDDQHRALAAVPPSDPAARPKTLVSLFLRPPPDLVRLRDERVRFSHDLLGDWARMRVLVGEQSLASSASRDRANLPRWHRAVRLYGQRVLEQLADGAERWQQAIAGLGDDSPTGSVIRDLFLESRFLASNAAALLERSWPAQCANGGRLLNRMLSRFLFVATLPDARVAALAQLEEDGAQFEYLFRVPYWPYWGPLLAVLHAHRDDVVRLAPINAAKTCSLWLKEMPRELSPGQPIPWRQEAAELALAIGREIQALNAEGNYFSDGQGLSAQDRRTNNSAPAPPDRQIRAYPHYPRSFQLFQACRLCVKSTGICSSFAVI
jgi:hypothetical protein